jgi:hypothetical protein
LIVRLGAPQAVLKSYEEKILAGRDGLPLEKETQILLKSPENPALALSPYFLALYEMLVSPHRSLDYKGNSANSPIIIKGLASMLNLMNIGHRSLLLKISF